MKKSRVAILLSFLIFLYLISFEVYCKKSINKIYIKDYDISIVSKKCINCPNMLLKKKINIKKDNSEFQFALTGATELSDTRIIIGETNKNSKLFKNGINKIIIFPNELEKLESFNFDTQEDLNAIGDGKFIWDNYYSDNTLEKILNDIHVDIDTTVSI